MSGCNAQIASQTAISSASSLVLPFDMPNFFLPLVERMLADPQPLRDLRYRIATLGDLTHRVALELFREIAFAFENRYQTKDGAYRLISWTAVPDNEFIHAVGRDVTEERNAAAALRQTELALQQAQKMEAIGNLTGGVAHDFNNLLQVVAGNLQLLAKDVTGNEKAQRRISNALAGVERGSKLASQLLAFGRRQGRRRLNRLVRIEAIVYRHD